jgi:hypothetical protein
MRGPAEPRSPPTREEDKMSRRTFVSIASVFGLVNSVPGLIAPAAVGSLYGVTVNSQSALFAQTLAVSYIGYAILNWVTREPTEIAMRRGIDAGNLVAWGASAAIWIYAASSGMTNAVGWVGAAFTVAFTLGWAYFVATDRATGMLTSTRSARI